MELIISLEGNSVNGYLGGKSIYYGCIGAHPRRQFEGILLSRSSIVILQLGHEAALGSLVADK